jgi:hypothetical protein
MNTPGAIMLAFLLVTHGFALSAEGGSGSEKPSAPAGFTAKRLDKIHCEVLVPTGWKISSFDQGGTLCFKITEDETCQKGLRST